MTGRWFAIASLLVLVSSFPVAAQDPATPIRASSLRPEWSVEAGRTGRAHVVGYLHNADINDAANVWLRVERLTATGDVGATYRGRVLGDVPSGGRLAFDVQVAEPGATYRLAVESVDWVKECR
jgi:hypothetical protein